MADLDELARMVRVGLLFDHYGPLLTEHQREAVDLYYMQDWSLQEIAESWSTSRQAVHDLLNRSVRQLEEYESALGLAERENCERETLRRLHELIGEAQAAVGCDDESARRILREAAALAREALGEETEMK